MAELEIESLRRTFIRKLMNTPMDFFRYLNYKIEWKDSLIGIKGPKGCGKTTMLLQHIKETFLGNDLDKVLYISLDNLYFASHDILDVVETHYNNGGTYIFIDEIHYYEKWQTLLKNISDDFPGLNIVYTGSSMLQIQAGEGDLSRRQAMYEMRGLSFREFLQFEQGIKQDAVELEDLLHNHIKIAMNICSQTAILPLFKRYLKYGYYPFYKDVHNGIDIRLQAVVNQIIENDYAKIDDVNISTIRKTKKMLMVLSERVPQQPNMSSLYRELETDRNQGLKMLYALQRGGLLLLLGDNVKSSDNLSRPDKIYVNNPTLMYALSPYAEIGTIRETFFFNQLSEAHECRYPKAGDFLVDKRYLFEVGGKNKTFEQIKDMPDSYLAVDDTEIGRGNKIPLWMFGLLY